MDNSETMKDDKAAAAAKAGKIKPSIFKVQFQRLGIARTVIGGLAMYSVFPFFVLLHFGIAVIYNMVIARTHMLKPIPLSTYVIFDRHKIKELGYLDRLHCVYCGHANGLAQALVATLEQIESTWCPIKHLEGRAIFPEHHKNFSGRSPAEISAAIGVLKEKGSVLPADKRLG